MTGRLLRFCLLVLGLWALGLGPAHAQQMPDPSLINGKALPYVGFVEVPETQ